MRVVLETQDGDRVVLMARDSVHLVGELQVLPGAAWRRDTSTYIVPRSVPARRACTADETPKTAPRVAAGAHGPAGPGSGRVANS